jgi:hypothetical protein
MAAATLALTLTNWYVQRAKGPPPDNHYLVSLESSLGQGMGIRQALQKLAGG